MNDPGNQEYRYGQYKIATTSLTLGDLFELLPDELIREILLRLGWTDILMVATTRKRLRHIVLGKTLRGLYSRRLKNRIGWCHDIYRRLRCNPPTVTLRGYTTSIEGLSSDGRQLQELNRIRLINIEMQRLIAETERLIAGLQPLFHFEGRVARSIRDASRESDEEEWQAAVLLELRGQHRRRDLLLVVEYYLRIRSEDHVLPPSENADITRIIRSVMPHVRAVTQVHQGVQARQPTLKDLLTPLDPRSGFYRDIKDAYDLWKQNVKRVLDI